MNPTVTLDALTDPHFCTSCYTSGATTAAQKKQTGNDDQAKMTMERRMLMAAQWGANSLAPGASQGWFFARANEPGFLPVLQVMPLSPSSTDSQWSVSGDGYPSENELGVSTIWSQLSDDMSTVFWFMVVQNQSNNIVEYAFLEADL